MKLLRCAPYFLVADVDRTVAFYESVIGFTREYVAGSPAVFAILGRDGLPIMLRRVADPAALRPSEAQGGTWDAFFWVDDVEALFEELHGNGADFAYAPVVREEYSMKEIAVRDIDGHVLGFGQEWPAV